MTVVFKKPWFDRLFQDCITPYGKICNIDEMDYTIYDLRILAPIVKQFKALSGDLLLLNHRIY